MVLDAKSPLKCVVDASDASKGSLSIIMRYERSCRLVSIVTRHDSLLYRLGCHTYSAMRLPK